ncbi:hypothetical protein [Microvirga makkahensis]|uniref:Uncharacterized protein n=1 Tax=Microvirga makkahensis TaxID=1128670 RepID=A0A7X3MXC7_9HYPH|nr:hypothetical protein [Microvirga makkahensis]MXQ14745.1 hypothetical protein [Microvirga makkahensis]
MSFRPPLRLPLLVLALGLTSCGYIPRPVAGVPPGAPWQALPLRKWLAENRAEPIALSFCVPPECSPGLAVSVIRLTGEDARITQAVLEDPERLARGLRSPAGRDKPVRTTVSVERLKDVSYPGFAISLAPENGQKTPAFGAALGRRSGDDLEVVLVIGDSAEAVRRTARRVAAREFGS